MILKQQPEQIDTEAEMTTIRNQLTNCDETMRILEDMYWNRISFVPNDPYTTAYQEGQRAVIGFLKQCRGEI